MVGRSNGFARRAPNASGERILVCTIPVAARPSHAFDPAPLDCWLRSRLPDLGGLREVSQVEGGQSNPTYRLVCERGAAALRKQPPGRLLPSAHRIDREWEFLRRLGAAAGRPVPVPEALAWCNDADLVGTPFYVMRWVTGTCHPTPLLGDLPADRRLSAYQAAFSCLAALHCQKPADLALDRMGRPEGHVQRQIQRWSAQYDSAATEPVASFDELRRALSDWAPGDAEPAVVHGDYRFANLILSTDGAQVAAVLDWELATIGHPLADVAHACVAFRCAPDTPGFPGIQGVDTLSAVYPTEDAALDRYVAAGGRSIPPDWGFWMAYALFRLAAISQGIFARGLNGNASSAHWREFGPAVDSLSRLGLDALRGRRQGASLRRSGKA